MKIFKNIFQIRNIYRSFCTKVEIKDEKFYEEEWNNAYLEKFKKNKDLLEQELSPSQKKECELISDAITILDPNEKKLFGLLVNEKMKKIFNKGFVDYTLSNPSDAIDMENLWPKDNPNWMKSPHLQATLSAFTGKASPGYLL
jgi:hypothetical protein